MEWKVIFYLRLLGINHLSDVVLYCVYPLIFTLIVARNILLALSSQVLVVLCPYSISNWVFKQLFNLECPHRGVIPLITVHGLFDFATARFSNLFDQYLAMRNIRIGLFISDVERAVQTFYEIKGGREYFGEQRAKKGKYSTWGETHVGVYPQWSSKYKINGIGHSQGASTLAMLHKLMDNNKEYKLFMDPSGKLYDTSSDWFLSVGTTSGGHNGTAFANQICDITPDGKFVKPAINSWRYWAVDMFIKTWFRVYDVCKMTHIKPLINLMDPRMQHYGNSTPGAGMLNWDDLSGTFAGGLMLNIAYERHHSFNYNPNVTYYHQMWACTIKDISTGYMIPRMRTIGPLRPSSTYMGDITQLNRIAVHLKEVTPVDFNNDLFMQNDGLVTYGCQGVIGFQYDRYKDRILHVPSVDVAAYKMTHASEMYRKISEMKLDKGDHFTAPSVGVVIAWNISTLYKINLSMAACMYQIEQLAVQKGDIDPVVYRDQQRIDKDYRSISNKIKMFIGGFT